LAPIFCRPRLTGYFFIIAGVAFVANLCQTAAFTAMGERLTRRLRSEAFRSLMRQDIAFFDEAGTCTHGC
jgi:ATP-binding cassette subfamily B (MDR/TAP) protein 1